MKAWHDIKKKKVPEKKSKILVTNNIKSRDAHGQMSHIWLVVGVHKEGNEYFAFDGSFTKIHNVTHWTEIPE